MGTAIAKVLCAVQYMTWVNVIFTWATSNFNPAKPGARQYLLTSLPLRVEHIASRGVFGDPVIQIQGLR